MIFVNKTTILSIHIVSIMFVFAFILSRLHYYRFQNAKIAYH